MTEEPKQSFMDSKTILAVVLVGLTWMGWQWYMQKKYPEAYKRKAAPVAGPATTPESAPESAVNEAAPSGAPSASTKSDELSKQPGQVDGTAGAPERLIQFEDAVWSFAITSKGMGIKDVTLKTHKGRDLEPKKLAPLASGFLPFETNLLGRRIPIDFEIEQVNDSEFVGKARLGELQITKTMKVDSANYVIDTQVAVQGASADFSGVNTYLSAPVETIEKGSFLLPQFEHQEFYVAHDGSSERVMITDNEDARGSFSKVGLTSIGSQYFSMAVLDRSDVMPDVETFVDKATRTAMAVFTYKVLNRSDSFSVAFKGFAGPKSQTLLAGIDPQMSGIVNFGWFNVIGTYILKLMRLFHGLVGNWGLAIILLTLVVRTLVLPFAIMSFKSMKGMQKIQPMLKDIRERHKEDPARANQEMMTLMREHKVNPMGGCLPTLLQFPVFLALYQVLGQSVELYQAPFGLWIRDLSLKDPFYVLPVLVGATMFFQMKVTPSTMDPTQQKVMMFLPILFSVFMLALPSGLNLYILVSTLFGLGQHFYFMREKSVLKPA